MAGKRRYPTDPNHPDFPHGTVTGYGLTCRCGPCGLTAARARKAWEYRRITGQLADTDRVDSAMAVAKLREYAKTHSLKQIARATGVRDNYIGRVVSGTYVPAKMTVATVRAIMTAVLDDGSDVLVPVWRYLQRVYSLAALGYPLMWISAQTGTKRRLSAYASQRRSDRPNDHVHTATFNRLEELYQTVGDTPAEEWHETFTRRQIAVAKSTAAKYGYYPPACYDEDGHLIPEAVRFEDLEARKAERDQLAVQRLEVLWLSLKYRLGAADIATRLRISSDLVNKVRLREAGLKFSSDTRVCGDGAQWQSSLREESVERGAQVLAILEAHYADSASDAYTVCREIGGGLLGAEKYRDIDVLAAERAAQVAAQAEQARRVAVAA